MSGEGDTRGGYFRRLYSKIMKFNLLHLDEKHLSITYFEFYNQISIFQIECRKSTPFVLKTLVFIRFHTL